MLKEKFLLVVGIAIILFGALGIVGTAFIYSNTKHHIDQLPIDIQQIFSITNHTISEASMAIDNAAYNLRTTADTIDISILGWEPFIEAADILREMAASIENVGGDMDVFTVQIESIKNSILNQMNVLTLILDVTFGWIGVLHTILILIGFSFIWIRKKLLI